MTATLADGLCVGRSVAGGLGRRAPTPATATYAVELDAAPASCAVELPAEVAATQSVCDEGEASLASVTVPASVPEVVSYSLSPDPDVPPGSYDVSGGARTVSVTATLAEGYVFGPLPEGWVEGTEPGTATYAVELDAAPASCAVELPAEVAATQSVCDEGEASLASVTVPASVPEVVSYSLSPDPDVPPGSYDVSGGARTVSVTATLAEGYVFGPLPEGWVEGTEPGTATYAVELDAAPASCAVELPAEVAATQSVCDEGEASLASVTVPASVPEVVSYSLSPDPDVPPGSYDVSGGARTVSVTATLAEGYVFGPLPEGWVEGTEPGTATYAVELDAAPASCAVELPAEVAATQSVCVEGEASLASVTVPASVPEVVSYSLSPDPDVPPGSYDVSGGARTVSVTATLAEGYVFGPLPEGWVEGTEPGTATYAVELDAAPASCAVELPAEVAATQSVCDEGEASLASVTVPASVPEVVSYSLSPDPDVPPGSYDVSGGCADGVGDGDVGRGLCVWSAAGGLGGGHRAGDGDLCGRVGCGAGVVCGGVAGGGGGDAVGVCRG